MMSTLPSESSRASLSPSGLIDVDLASTALLIWLPTAASSRSSTVDVFARTADNGAARASDCAAWGDRRGLSPPSGSSEPAVAVTAGVTLIVVDLSCLKTVGESFGADGWTAAPEVALPFPLDVGAGLPSVTSQSLSISAAASRSTAYSSSSSVHLPARVEGRETSFSLPSPLPFLLSHCARAAVLAGAFAAAFEVEAFRTGSCAEAGPCDELASERRTSLRAGRKDDCWSPSDDEDEVI